MNKLLTILKTTKHKKFFFVDKSIYRPISTISSKELDELELQYSFNFPVDIRRVLLCLGSCTIAEELNIHQSREIYPLCNDNTLVSGHIVFASDTSGNYIMFNPKRKNEGVYICYHDSLEIALLGKSIKDFLGGFINNEFKIKPQAIVID